MLYWIFPLLGLLHCHLTTVAFPSWLIPTLAFVLLIVLCMLSILNWSYFLHAKHSFLQYIVGIGKHQGAKSIGHIFLKDKLGLWLLYILIIDQMLLKIIYVLYDWSISHFTGNQCYSSPLNIVRGDKVVQYVRLHCCKCYHCLIVTLTVIPSMCSVWQAIFGKQGFGILIWDASYCKIYFTCI